MRIGIITQPLYVNYGGILQNYALQHVLKQMGHTPVTLDYMPSLSFGRYVLYAGKGLLCALIPGKRHPIKRYQHFLNRPPAMEAFVTDNIFTTQTLSRYTKRVLDQYKIQALIAGSDQIWRYSYNAHYIDDMYLAFAKGHPCQKIAYGASLGVEEWDYPEDKTHTIQQLVKQFKAISVREDLAAKLCKNHLGINAEIVLDPTLLLSAEDYDRFCHEGNPGASPYLAAYILDADPEKRKYIENVANTKGLEIRDLTVSDNGVSIEEWLSVIKNAEFVITDSFHGSLFSIIFKKQFLTFLNRGRGTDRFLSLFGKLGLEQRLLDHIPAEAITDHRIDYESVFSNLLLLRGNSLSFLQNALKQ